jgi:hypothetical protein
MLTIDPIGSAEAGFSLLAFWIGFEAEASAVVDSDGELSLGGAGSAWVLTEGAVNDTPMDSGGLELPTEGVWVVFEGAEEDVPGDSTAAGLDEVLGGVDAGRVLAWVSLTAIEESSFTQ